MNKQKLLVQVGVSFLNAAGVDCSCTATLRMYSHYIPYFRIANKLYKKNKLLYTVCVAKTVSLEPTPMKYENSDLLSQVRDEHTR